MERLYNDLEQRLGRGAFFCGDFSWPTSPSHRTYWRRPSLASRSSRHPGLIRWIGRVQQRPAVARDNGDVMETLQCLQAEGQPAFDPYRVQWRSDRLEWVIKNGFADWFADEMRAGRAFFPVTVAR